MEMKVTLGGGEVIYARSRDRVTPTHGWRLLGVVVSAPDTSVEPKVVTEAGETWPIGDYARQHRDLELAADLVQRLTITEFEGYTEPSSDTRYRQGTTRSLSDAGIQSKPVGELVELGMTCDRGHPIYLCTCPDW